MTLSLPEVIRVLLPNGAVKKLPLEEYVRGVVTAALPADAPLEALKAQAVAARTFGASTRRHIERGADVCTLRHCQVWKEVASAAAGRAAGATRGIVAQHNGRLIEAYYFEHCDGNTRDATGLLVQASAYLQGVACPCGFATLKGHGIGMCQRGALVMARFGDTFEMILKHYYTGITLERAGVIPTSSPLPTRPLTSQKPPIDLTDSGEDQGSTEESKIPSVAPASSSGFAGIEAEVAERTPQTGPSEEADKRLESAEEPIETPVVYPSLTAEPEAPPPAQVLEPPSQPVVELLPTPVQEPPTTPLVELLPTPVQESSTAPVVESTPTPIAELPPAPSTQVQASKSKRPKRAAKTKKPAGTKSRGSKKTAKTPPRSPRRHRVGRKEEPKTSFETPAALEEAIVVSPPPPTVASSPDDALKSQVPPVPVSAGAAEIIARPESAQAPAAPVHVEAIEASALSGIEAEELSRGDYWYPVAEEVSSEADKLEAEMIDEVLDASTATITPEVESAAIVQVPALPEIRVAPPPPTQPSAGSEVPRGLRDAPVEEPVKLPLAPETMPEEMPFSAVAKVPVELPTPVPPPPLLEEEFGEAPSMGPVPEVLIDHLPGPRMIAGDLSKPGIIITIRDGDGHAVVTVSGAAPQHGAGGFEAPLAGDGTYAVSFNHHALEVNLRDETVFICYTG